MSPRPRLLLVLAAAVLASCGGADGDGAPAHASFELLRARPDRVFEQIAALEPGEEQWGAFGVRGWKDETGTELGDQRIAHVWSSDRGATLELPAAVARDRTLRITIAGPPESEPQELRVRLNGVQLARLSLPERPAELAIEAPLATWRVGANLLELEIDRRTRLVDGSFVGFAVCRVVYDEPSRVDVAPAEARLRLGPRTAVAYDLELLAPTEVRLRGRAEGRGRLELRLTEVDPRTGDETAELFASEVELEDQPLERGIAVPELRGRIARLVLRWTSDERASGFVASSLQRIEAGPAHRPPVIFISIDTLSARHLPFYGYARDTAPHMSELARDAVLFEDCRTNAPWTLPSYLAAFTGLYANAHKLAHKDGAEVRPNLWEMYYLAENRWTIAEVLHAAGYETAAITSHGWLAPRYGFGQGFDQFDNSAYRSWKGDRSGGVRLVVEKALSFLDGKSADDPFFLFVHALDAHGPYVTLPEFRGRFAEEPLYDPNHDAPVGGSPLTLGIIPDYQLIGTPYADFRSPARVPTAGFADAYDEGILAIDDALGKLIAELRERGLYEQSLIVLSADHGESMGGLRPLVRPQPAGARGVARAAHRAAPGRAGRGQAHLEPRPARRPPRDPARRLGARGPRLPRRHLAPPADRGRAGPAPRTIYAEGGLMSQRCVVRDGWKLVQQNPAVGSPPQSLLSRPDLLERWHAEILPWAERQDWPAGPLERISGPAPIRIFERIRAEGLHLRLMEGIENDADGRLILRLLTRFFDREELHLYDLRRDPDARVDVAAEHPDKVAELSLMMERQHERMLRAQRDARPPWQPVELSEEAIAELQALGYAGD